MKALTAVLAFSALVGCASAPVDLATAPVVPEDRVFDAGTLKPGPGSVPVIVSVDTASIGACCIDLKVNGRLAAKIGRGEILRLNLPKGRNTIEMNIGKTEAFRSVVTEVMSAEYAPYKYRVLSLDGRNVIQPDTR